MTSLGKALVKSGTVIRLIRIERQAMTSLTPQQKRALTLDAAAAKNPRVMAPDPDPAPVPAPDIAAAKKPSWVPKWYHTSLTPADLVLSAEERAALKKAYYEDDDDDRFGYIGRQKFSREDPLPPGYVWDSYCPGSDSKDYIIKRECANCRSSDHWGEDCPEEQTGYYGGCEGSIYSDDDDEHDDCPTKAKDDQATHE